MSDAFAAAPAPAYRLVPSRFPPIGPFDSVATAADLAVAMELVGWTNDRLVAERVRRLPENDWVFGRPNSSVVMAAFLHVAPGGMRFNGPALGAWYAANALRTAIAEVGHHLRREAAATSVASLTRLYREYQADIDGSCLDIRGQQTARPDLYASDSYAASQGFGEGIRASGGDGILYNSVRHAGGTNVVAFRPRKIDHVIQCGHYEITVAPASSTIGVHLITGAGAASA